MEKPTKKKLTKSMSFVGACRALGVNESDITSLFDIVKSSNSATLNHCNRVVDLIGYDNYILLRDWLYK